MHIQSISKAQIFTPQRPLRARTAPDASQQPATHVGSTMSVAATSTSSHAVH